MKSVTVEELQKHLGRVLDGVVDDRAEVAITRTGKEPVVIVLLAEYASLKEMDYLMRSPENWRRLIEGVAALDGGLGQEHDLIRS